MVIAYEINILVSQVHKNFFTFLVQYRVSLKQNEVCSSDVLRVPLFSIKNRIKKGKLF